MSTEVELADTVGLLDGRTIVAVDYYEDSNGQGADLTLTLDSGVVVNVSSWGHDWWGLHITADEG